MLGSQGSGQWVGFCLISSMDSSVPRWPKPRALPTPRYSESKTSAQVLWIQNETLHPQGWGRSLISRCYWQYNKWEDSEVSKMKWELPGIFFFFFFWDLVFRENAPPSYLWEPDQVLHSETAPFSLAGHKVTLSNICLHGSSSYLFLPAR